MVRTRADLKIKIHEWIEEQTEPFKTRTVQDYARGLSSNILVTPQRLQNYIRGTNKVNFNPSKKEWTPKIDLKPKIR